MRHRVVIVGGGFGGLQAARRLRGAPVEITLVDRRNFHLFQPLTYQVATGALSPGEVAYPLRGDLQAARERPRADGRGHRLRPRGARGPVPTATGSRCPYDTLIVAGGSSYSYFGHDEWRALAPEVKSLESALDDARPHPRRVRGGRRSRAIPTRRRALLTFVVVGAGPTGVEMAGQIAELARDTLRRDFRADRPARGARAAGGDGRPGAHDLSAERCRARRRARSSGSG